MSAAEPSLQPRQLIIMRHAKSSWADPGMADFDRPLNPRGRAAAPVMGQRLEEADTRVDLILASTAERVRQTLDYVQTKWQPLGSIFWQKQVYLASVPTLIGLLAALHDDWSRVMVVGHNPGLSELVMTLTGHEVDMPTAAIAMLNGPAAPWRDALRMRPWQQRAYWTPKDED